MILRRDADLYGAGRTRWGRSGGIKQPLQGSLPRDGSRADCHNCHDRTGLLPFFDAETSSRGA